jgi:hypothetical protein
MSIFWVPDEDDPPGGGPPPGTVADEVARWIDERAVHRAEAMIRELRLRLVTTAHGLPRRLARRLEPPSLRHRRAS